MYIHFLNVTSKKFGVILIFIFVCFVVFQEVLEVCIRWHYEAVTEFQLEHCECTRKFSEINSYQTSFFSDLFSLENIKNKGIKNIIIHDVVSFE